MKILSKKYAPGQVYVWRLFDGTYFFRIRLVSTQGIQGTFWEAGGWKGVCNFWWRADGSYAYNRDYDLKVRASGLYMALRGVTP